jgi:lipopolysaccharide/colanic/teichoic acid biosynthesis glycosyltransferase
MFGSFAKRAFDITVAGSALLVAAPALGVVALLVRKFCFDNSGLV